jgi:aminocarboxymuconate-semialdehyde decarboxylase
MVRIVFSGVLEKYPNLRFITHHCGAMIPYFSERITVGQDYAETHLKAKWKQTLTKPPIEYFRKFYGDTALNGNTPALMCGHAFFGAAHVIFATDFPFDDQEGDRFTREVIKAVETMSIPENDKQMIFEGNVRRLLFRS